MTHGQAVVRHIAWMEAFISRICPHCRTITLHLNGTPTCQCGYINQRDPLQMTTR